MSLVTPVSQSDKYAVRQLVEVRREGPLRAIRTDPLGMEPVVDQGHPDLLGRHVSAIRRRPGVPGGQEPPTLALEARSMTGGQPGHPVEKKSSV